LQASATQGKKKGKLARSFVVGGEGGHNLSQQKEMNVLSPRKRTKKKKEIFNKRVPQLPCLPRKKKENGVLKIFRIEKEKGCYAGGPQLKG